MSRAADGAVDPIQAQYERWAYPPRVEDLDALPLTRIDWHYNDLRVLWPLYWPAEPFREDVDILVAGCGTISGAIVAHLFPKANVVGIDVSRASLSHEELLKEKHHLKNLTLRHLPIEEIASLDCLPAGGFDHIVCHGVLHHTADPAVSLKRLGEVLRTTGVIDVMVYGKHGRAGVTMLQQLFRVMELKQDDDGVRLVKDVLGLMPQRHPVRTYLTQAAEDLSSDEGIVDTFLNARDVPFSVADCFKLVDDAGLVFQGWKDNAIYHVDARLPADHPVRAHLERLPEREMWQAVELIDAAIPGHWFHVCRQERDPATYEIRFEGDSFLDYVPISRVTHVEFHEPERVLPLRIGRAPFPPLILEYNQSLLLSKVDGTATVRKCIERSGMQVSDQSTVEYARRFFCQLWRIGYAFFGMSK